MLTSNTCRHHYDAAKPSNQIRPRSSPPFPANAPPPPPNPYRHAPPPPEQPQQLPQQHRNYAHAGGSPHRLWLPRSRFKRGAAAAGGGHEGGRFVRGGRNHRGGTGGWAAVGEGNSRGVKKMVRGGGG